MKNKVKFGLSNVHIATFSESDGKITYDKPIAIPGAVNLTLSPAGDSTDFYADNIIYYTGSINQGYEGELELAMLPDELRATIFGETKDAAGAYIESADDIIKPFALGFQIKGDVSGRKFWYYNTVSKRVNNDAKTGENSKTPSTDKLSIKTMPRSTDKKVRVFLPESATNQEAYASFFDQVYESVTES